MCESPSSNPLEHLTETLETSWFRHAFLSIPPPHRGISFGDRFVLLESNTLALNVEKGQAKKELPLATSS